ncbi:MAG: hydantoinase B/oxoprolinase family protein [Solirubrobacteraceae bacterium]
MDAAELQVLAGALHAICEEMGAVLIRAAHSPNIKERRDASTALFDAGGEMVMQAEHIPVHLGAMGAAVRAVLESEHAPGRSWILNDPYRGGTHLPDITVITPVFAAPARALVARDGSNRRLAPVRSISSRPIAFAASRAHHADVGGPTPGSMPADSRTLADEGVVIEPRVLDEATLVALSELMRAPEQRRADLRAQLAACRVGAVRVAALAERIGVETLLGAFDAVLDYAERRTRACLAALDDGVRRARDVLEAREGDLPIELAAAIDGDHLTLDFTGTAPQHAGNLNCPLAVTHSACCFALRVLTDPDIPANAGTYRPLTVIAPEGSLLNARASTGGAGGAPAVAGGNVETSSRIADVVLAAFGRALGQGTMNNLTLGDERVTYYETLGGGQGACADGDGPSAVHVAMSNTLNTPVEALELELPLRVTEYSLRRGSGGAGAFRGGDGVVRELEALAPLRFSLITERRRHAPPGAAGGKPGAPGRNLLDGVQLDAKATGSLAPGQRLRIETPGGGGHGTPRAPAERSQRDRRSDLPTPAERSKRGPRPDPPSSPA